jgi:hypothetical protein
MLQGSLRVLLALFMRALAAMLSRSAMTLRGGFMLLRSRVVRFDDVGLFIHGKTPFSKPGFQGSLNQRRIAVASKVGQGSAPATVR